MTRVFENRWAACFALALPCCLAWFAANCPAAEDAPLLTVKRLVHPMCIDGKLAEPCYNDPPTVARFVVAGAPDAQPQPTKAWLFWDPDRLIFAFQVEDKQQVARPRSDREHDVDAQDRVEIFLWSGRASDAYYCVEIGARGAIHDYAARFYRKFDDGWAPAAMQVAVTSTETGYCVEGELSRAALEAAGFRLRAGEELHCGLFRADFTPGRPAEPTWICWVDARGSQPDFHVAKSFGRIRLAAETRLGAYRRSDP
jgi:hypothetical protein